MDQDTFIEQFETQFLATWAANQFSQQPKDVVDYAWLKDAPLKEARLMVRNMWYHWLGQFGPPVPWR